jgi:glyoxylase-like metal-dependent hydrolase (beta-lactamase superfamily II)
MTTWMLGGISATRVPEGVGLSSCAAGEFLTGFDAEVFRRHLGWMVPVHYSPEEDRLVLSIHTWLIRTPRHTVLVDSCSGNDKNRPWNARFHRLNTPYLERLAAAGVRPEDVDIVLCTHLHTDHCGWNTRLENGRWVPTFPNAKYIFSRKEKERWDPAVAGAKARAELYADSVLPVIESGQAVLIEGTHAIDDALLIEPAPGHTPGHVWLKARHKGEEGVFCGDAIHHPVQVFEPRWGSYACDEPQLARETRRRLLEYCAEKQALLFPTHFATPHVAAILALGDRFVPAFVPGQD